MGQQSRLIETLQGRGLTEQDISFVLPHIEYLGSAGDYLSNALYCLLYLEDEDAEPTFKSLTHVNAEIVKVMAELDLAQRALRSLQSSLAMREHKAKND